MRAMMMRVWAVATSTFWEAVRNRAFLGMLLGALVMIAASMLLSQMVVFDQRQRVVLDFGLFFISFVGVLISIVIGVLLIFKDLERKTIYALLTKPIRRFEFVLGRFFGVNLILLLMFGLMTGAWLLVMKSEGVGLRVVHFQALALVFVQLGIVSSVAILFSAFSSPVLSGIFTFGIFAVGRQIDFIRELLISSKGPFASFPWLKPVGQGVVAVFPDLTLFDVTRQILLDVEIPWSYVGYTTLYGIGYIIVFVLSAMAIFNRREFV